MQTMTRVSAVRSPVRASLIADGSENLTDLYIGTGKIGHRPLSSAC